MNENPTLYVVLNKELKMSAGKAAAQTAHAVAMLGSRNEPFIGYNKRTVIVLEAENAEQIKNLSEYLDQFGLYNKYYIDEGANEVGAYSVTALACEPVDRNFVEHREIFTPFKLFSGEGDSYEEAYKYLSRVSRGFLFYNGIGKSDASPRFMKKTLKFLESRMK